MGGWGFGLAALSNSEPVGAVDPGRRASGGKLRSREGNNPDRG